MNPRSKILRYAVVTLLVWSVFAMAVFAIDARWRLYTEISDLGWIVMAIPIVAIAAFKGFHIRWSLPVLVLLLALGVVSYRTVKTKNLRRAISQCANHSSFTGVYFTGDEFPKTLTNSIEFADYVEQLSAPNNRPRAATSCPGRKWSRTKTGIAFVGGGMRPHTTATNEQILIAFCFFDSHPLPFDHLHCLSLSSNRPPNTNGIGMVDRSCSNTRDMTNRLAIALKQARNGLVPYTKEAQSVMEVELQKRIQALDRAGVVTTSFSAPN